MVLSNKKLKQKLRATLENSAATPPSGTDPKIRKSDPDPNSLPQSLKELLDSVTQKPRLSKREKRRKAISFRSENRDNNESEKEVGEEKMEVEGQSKGVELVELRDNCDGSDVKKEKKKKKQKKRKRDGENENREVGEEEKEVMRKAWNLKKNKKKKKKIENKKGKSDEENKGVELKVTETTKIDASQVAEHMAGDVANKVYVGGIPYYSTEDDIRSYFEGCGTITEVDCMKFPESGKFRGIAIISFKTDAAARRALAFDGSDMGGLFLKIQPYKSTRAYRTPNFAPQIIEGYNRIYVGNLSWDITEEDLKKFFSDCNITSIRFGTDKETGDFKGYAHVDFPDNLSLSLALKLDQEILCGRPVKISCAVPRRGGKTHSISSSMREVANPMEKSNSVSMPASEATNDGGSSTVSGKMRRRTCYECGEKGHVSSACPKKQTADLVNTISSTELPKEGGKTNPTPVPTSEEADPVETNDSVSVATTANDGGTSTVSGKIRRRTCYECGVKGHISSACPKKQTKI